MNESINKSNYEAYFLDYLEGRLSAADAEDLFAFLITHPSLAEELEEMRVGFEVVNNISDLELHSETLDEQAKFTLRKTDDGSGLSNNDLLLVKELEGDISLEERALLDALCAKNQQLYRERAAMKKTKLVPPAVTFEEKATIAWPMEADMSDIDMLLAAAVEGDLNASEIHSLQSLFSSPAAFQSALLRMRQAVLAPTIVLFEHKASLRRKETVVIPLRRYLAYTAAAAAMAVLIYTVWPQQNTNARMAATWENEQIDLQHSTPPLPQEKQNTQETSWLAPTKIQYRLLDTQLVNNLPSGIKRDSLPSNSASPEKANAPQEVLYTNQEEKNLPESIAPLTKQEALAQDENPVTYEADNQKFFTIREIVEYKVKSWVWGGKNYPDKSFGMALLNREFEKYTSKMRKKKNNGGRGLEFENVNTQHEHFRRFKIGRFEYKKHLKK
jgi:hypothetical protein